MAAQWLNLYKHISISKCACTHRNACSIQMYFTYNSCVWILQIHVLQNSFLTAILSVSVMGEEETRGLQSVFRQKTPSRFRPYVVLEFAVGAKQPAIEWMIDHQPRCELFDFMHRKMQHVKHLLILMTSLLFFGNLVYAQLSKFWNFIFGRVLCNLRFC